MHARRSRSGRMAQRTRGNEANENDGQHVAAKIGLLTALLVALIGATATIVAALISTEPSPDSPSPAPAHQVSTEMPRPTCPTCYTGGLTFTQQANFGTPKRTFQDPRAFRGIGPEVQPGQEIEVVCRFHDPNAPLSVQPGWWYLIASPPWNRQYYTVANSYLNGDPPEDPSRTPVDNGVPVC